MTPDSSRDIDLVRGTGDPDQGALRVEFSFRSNSFFSQGGGYCSGGRAWRDKKSNRDFFGDISCFRRLLFFHLLFVFDRKSFGKGRAVL